MEIHTHFNREQLVMGGEMSGWEIGTFRVQVNHFLLNRRLEQVEGFPYCHQGGV